jgi:ABC-type nickel/cobalt efflux system permease component RcnA
VEQLLNVYRSLSGREKALAWAVLAAVVVAAISLAGQNAVAWAQVASALATVVLAGLAYAQVRELRDTRIEQQRPHVIVDADHSRPPFVYVVLRNIGQGAARDISFEFSAPMESPESVDNPFIPPVNEQPYFARGLDYLAPGAEIPCLWGSMIDLADFLRERGQNDGVIVTSRYGSLDGGQRYETRWTLNPLLMANRISARRKGIHEIAEATEEVAANVGYVVDRWRNELHASTEAEREGRDAAQG